MSFSLRQATAKDDELIANYFKSMWAEYDLDGFLVEDSLERTLGFIERARKGLEYAAFIAESEGKAIGSAACQVFAGLYPSVFQVDKRKYGYIWGIYVTPESRGQGVARALTERCLTYFTHIGCTKAVLHASPMGKLVYERLGFVASNEMTLELG